ncbi:DUF362 domain-containing protein [Thermoproteota archaeon]
MKRLQMFKENFFLFGLGCLIWYVLRTGSKPSRATYPCQQAAAFNANLWVTTYFTPILIVGDWKGVKEHWKTVFVVILLGVGIYRYMSLNNTDISEQDLTPVKLKLEPNIVSDPISSIYAVTGTNGKDNGVSRLIQLMNEQGQPFYLSTKEDDTQGHAGFIGNDDVVLIKVNSQWDERGGTNTDLVKSIINAITKHPDGWKGEIIVADNGQAQFGGAGRGGSLEWGKNNAEDQTQSVQDVVDMFAVNYKVSTYLWDTITSNVVQEFAEGDDEDGFVVQTNIISSTNTVVSYPKFTTLYKTQISFKYGVYKLEIDDYDVDKLKVINVPVLKSHGTYGVTGAIKHYMGVPSDKLSASLGYRIHSSVGLGAMGTLMAQTRVPTLNIIDAIYVNALPKGGPKTPYMYATQTNIIAASTDPVAIDYWASKYVLCAICAENGDNTSTMDPDNISDGGFGAWLRLSMNELNAAGYPFTLDENVINVFVSVRAN